MYECNPTFHLSKFSNKSAKFPMQSKKINVIAVNYTHSLFLIQNHSSIFNEKSMHFSSATHTFSRNISPPQTNKNSG